MNNQDTLLKDIKELRLSIALSIADELGYSLNSPEKIKQFLDDNIDLIDSKLAEFFQNLNNG